MVGFFEDYHPTLPADQNAAAIVARVFAGFSSLGAALTVATLLGFPTLRANKSRRNVVYASICVLISHFLFAVGSFGGTSCTFQGILTQYFVLAAFFWSACIATETWRAVTKKSGGISSTGTTDLVGGITGIDLLYHVVSWLFPFIITLSTALSGGYAQIWTGWCWVSTTKPVTLAFMIPALIVFSYNVVFAAIVMYEVNKTVNRAKAYRRSDMPGKKWSIPLQLRVFLGMCVTFGFVFTFHIILWISQPASGANAPLTLFILDAMFTYSVGIFLFISILRNRAVISAYRKLFGLPHIDSSAEIANQSTMKKSHDSGRADSLGSVDDPIDKYRA